MEGSARTLTGVVKSVVFCVSVLFTDTDTDEIKRCETHVIWCQEVLQSGGFTVKEVSRLFVYFSLIY